MATRIYSGASPTGSVDLGSRSVPFVKGEPLEVTDDEAARLDRSGGWSVPKPSKPKGVKPDPEGSEPDPKES